MKFKYLIHALALTLLAVAPAAVAGEEHQEHNVNVIKLKSGDGDPVVLKFVNETGFGDMADGEARTITAESGEAVTVTRNGNKLNMLTSNGQSFDVPFMGNSEGMQVHAAHTGGTEKRIKIMKHVDSDSDGAEVPTMLITSEDLSDAQKAIMIEAAQEAGIAGELQFVGSSGGAGIDINIEKEIVSETD